MWQDKPGADPRMRATLVDTFTVIMSMTAQRRGL